jgi:hypothetical protein
MKTIVKILAVLAVLMVTFRPQTTALADVRRYKLHGAYALFYSTSADGCIQTTLTVELGEETVQYIEIQRVDTCLNQPIFEGYGSQVLSKSDLRYFGNLKSARLTTTLHVYDLVSQSSVDLLINLTWTGTGEILVLQHHDNYEPWPGCRVSIQSREEYRDAQVTGTVLEGTTNYTPEPAIDDNLFFTNSKRISHGCE